MRTVGVIGAMELEIAELKGKMDITEIRKAAGTDFVKGEIDGRTVVLVKCGIGKVNAAVCTQALIGLYGADCVINTGVAGALSAELDIGDVVVSMDLMHHDFDTSFTGDPPYVIPGLGTDSFKADAGLIAAAKAAGEEVLKGRHNVFTGRIATGDQFVSEKEKKHRILSDLNALCVEMEGAAVAQTCYLNRIPFVVVRAVSDRADEKAAVSFEKFVGFAAKNSADIVERMIKNNIG